MNRFTVAAIVTSFFLPTFIVKAQVPQMLNNQGRVSVDRTNFGGAVTSVNIVSNTITAANMAPGAGAVPSGAFVLSQTVSNPSLTAAGSTPFTANVFLSGTNWTQATPAAQWSARNGHAAVVFNGQMWVLGGLNADGNTFLNDVWS
jgi:hypothetical protein